MDTIEKFPLTSLDITEHQLQKLKALFPEVFTEGDKIDFEKLKLTLGEAIDTGRERYGMAWPGKGDCFKTIQQPSLATLVPDRDGSVNFDTTENLFIEGDNLEVLKLLQKSYLGKVKMIYIDPPYNTGNDFIYPDNYSESLDTYLEYTGQVDGEGRRFATNTETDGRFHSKWLNMMYPRLFLAKNLLREDGVIFISIDDGESANLRKICDEILGEENFIGEFIINSSPSAIDYGHIAKMHDYALFYAKNLEETITSQLPEENKAFAYKDEIGPFNIYPLYNGNVAFTPKNRPNLYYPFYVNPNNKIAEVFFEIGLKKLEGWIEVYPVVSKKEGIQKVWRWGKPKAALELNKEILGYKTESGEFRVVQKTRHTGKVIRSLQIDKDVSTRRGTGEVEEMFNQKIFPFPKPAELIRRFTSVSTEAEDIILDIFAGSATTAHAVLELNKQDGGNRKFICVQLPEPTDEKSEAYKAGYKNIAEISKERIRRVRSKIIQELNHLEHKLSLNEDELRHLQITTAGSDTLFVDENKNPFEKLESHILELKDKIWKISNLDLGFKSFRLAPSNFKRWNAAVEKTPDAIQAQLYNHIDHIAPGASQEAILYELLLKSGFPLATPIETLALEGGTVFSIASGALLLCLEKELTAPLLKAMAERKPQRVLCLDEGFGNNDQLKTNAVQLMKSKNVLHFQTV